MIPRTPIAISGNEELAFITWLGEKDNYVLAQMHVVRDLDIGPTEEWMIIPKEMMEESE